MIVGFSTPKKTNILSKLIQKFLKTEYSHTYIAFNIAFSGNYVVFQANRHGVQCYDYKRFIEENDVVYSEILTDAASQERAIKYCLSQLGKPYSFWNIIAIYLGIRLKDGERRFICSELVARALGMPSNNYDNITPKEVYDYLKGLRNG